MNQTYLVIDGSQGEGGGQVLRSSLSLAMCLGRSIEIKNIRAGRKKSGLLRQHLTCVKAAQEICQANVEGAELGAKEISFQPHQIKAGKYHFNIGTAGSTNLVFQTILPALLQAKEISEVCLEGGTHNMHAPSYEYINHCFLPVLAKMNLAIQCEILRYGFYPKGGGKWVAYIQPSIEAKKLKLLKRGSLLSCKARALIAKIPLHVSQRELAEVHRQLDWLDNDLIEQEVDSSGSGNIISLQLTYQHCNTAFEAVAQRGIRAEQVAINAITQLLKYQYSNAVVDEHLSDQLLLPMVLNQGGEFITHALSQHTKTNIAVINQFIPDAITISNMDVDTVKVIVKGA